MSGSKPKADVTRTDCSKALQATEAASSATTEDKNVNITDTPNMVQFGNMLEALKRDICEKIDASVSGLRGEVASVRSELRSTIEPLKTKINAFEHTIADLEHASSDHSDKLTEMEATVNNLKSQITVLTDRCEDLEARSRRNNIRLVGLPEGTEGQRPSNFVAQLLMDLLGLDEVPLLDTAHRTPRPKPKVGEAPRPLVIRVHFFHVRNEILRRASESSRSAPLQYQNKNIFIFADYTASIAKKRAAFGAVKRQLHTCSGVKFGLLYPATLKITTPDGTSHTFADPNAAMAFINANLKETVIT